MLGGSDSAGADDVDLVRLAAGGDGDAFAAIFERYQHVVYRFARAMTGSADVAEDATQQVFVILIQGLKRYEPERATLSTYLYGVARNVCRDCLRRERRFFMFRTQDPAPPVDTERDDPFQRMAAVERGANIRSALARVPVKYREVIVLSDLHDRSYAEIGAILGISTNAVRSRLYRGRQLLRLRLSREGRTRHPHVSGSSIRGVL